MQNAIFRAKEIINMAMQIEREGIEFYRHCATKDMAPALSQIFNYLIAQEKEHLQVFAKIMQGLDDYQLPESYPGEMRSYIKSFVEDRVFTKEPQGLLPHVDNEDQALEFAIEFEKRSILFYSAISQLVRDSEREVVELVIAEEHKHIRRLLELQRNLSQ